MCLISIKSLGSLLAIISNELSFVGSASTLKICIGDGFCSGVLKIRNKPLASMSDVADCNLRLDA